MSVAEASTLPLGWPSKGLIGEIPQDQFEGRSVLFP
jgi:hypothetical protein